MRPLMYEVRWLHAPRIVLIHVWDELLLGEIRHGSKEVVRLLDEGTAPVHVVVDVTQMTSFPYSVSEINSAGDFFRHPNLRYLVVHGVKSPTVRIILQLLSAMSSFELRIIDTRHDALAILMELDDTLPRDL